MRRLSIAEIVGKEYYCYKVGEWRIWRIHIERLSYVERGQACKVDHLLLIETTRGRSALVAFPPFSTPSACSNSRMSWSNLAFSSDYQAGIHQTVWRQGGGLCVETSPSVAWGWVFVTFKSYTLSSHKLN